MKKQNPHPNSVDGVNGTNGTNGANNSIPVVFERLEVGPPVIEPQRLTVPYTLYPVASTETTETKKSAKLPQPAAETFDLVYRYREDVFQPDDPVSMNLAAMMGAQVALNYSLFCKSIVFYGPFDHTDRRFLQDMAENTAREITVKKFMEPNPFLVGDSAALTLEKRSRYSQAILVFPDSGGIADNSVKWRLSSTDRRKHAILSSGGKDSLLTYGLLDEIGCETHPIFVNESGRHWFTALNAFNHFDKHIANTARVWTNCDRLFAWMLRHMPFIRQDFSRLRSDEYPIRLWTVAVFLFGALPLLRKRKIARLLIGDEYDTTRRLNHKGITHYDGLYDQSRYFDNALSRYFMRKGWSISQFSILRPLSELSIQTLLAKRYPHLLELQVSCHAAHKEGDRVYPCGNCEKCRRIVAMLTAVDVSPEVCGYKPHQFSRCLEAVIADGVNQDGPSVRQLTLMLAERGAVTLPGAKQKKLKPHPEILKLRFDPERSPLDGIPVDLRAALYPIYLQHTTGALLRSGREWNDCAPLESPLMNRPYPYEMEAASKGRTPSTNSAELEKRFLWSQFTWTELEERLKIVDIALLPVGSIEQHGPHLPLDTDAFDAEYLAHRVARACSLPKPLVLPLIPYGVSYEHDHFAGTVSIGNKALSAMVYDIGISISRFGIKKLVIINGHGGNGPSLNYAAQMINRDAGIFVCVDSGETSDVDIDKLAETPNDVHAGEIETSTSLAIRPQMVKKELAPSSVPQFSSRYLNFTSRRGVSWYAATQKVSDNGVLGDATKATVEKGRKIWEVMIAHLLALIEDLKGMTLDEIHRKRL